ncbi:MAG: hypothetical protein WCE75_05265 [Terracidiphilus sp.]
MGILDSLFGARKTAPAPTSASSPAVASDWYCADSSDRSVRQIVLAFPPQSVAESKFGILILPADKYPVLTQSSWCAGFATINSQSVGMFRAGEFAGGVKTAGLTLALSFCHMPSHAFLLASIRVESPQMTAAVRRRHPNAPPVTHPVAEWISGLSPFDREMVQAVFAQEIFRLVLADDSGGSSSAIQPDGSWLEGHLPRVVCEFHKPLSAELKKAFNERWRALVAHGDSIPSYRRNFQAAVGAEILRVLPTDKDPVLPRPR